MKNSDEKADDIDPGKSGVSVNKNCLKFETPTFLITHSVPLVSVIFKYLIYSRISQKISENMTKIGKKYYAF